MQGTRGSGFRVFQRAFSLEFYHTRNLPAIHASGENHGEALYRTGNPSTNAAPHKAASHGQRGSSV